MSIAQCISNPYYHPQECVNSIGKHTRLCQPVNQYGDEGKKGSRGPRREYGLDSQTVSSQQVDTTLNHSTNHTRKHQQVHDEVVCAPQLNDAKRGRDRGTISKTRTKPRTPQKCL